MNNTHDVISAFLDDRPFNPEELADALNDPAGRALLIDLIVLRRIVQPTDPVPAMTVTRAGVRQPWRTFAAAAVLILALAGGYLAGARRESTTSAEAPPPTRTVAAVPFIPEGGMR